MGSTDAFNRLPISGTQPNPKVLVLVVVAYFLYVSSVATLFLFSDAVSELLLSLHSED